jgi:hypothetical protein
VTPLGGREIGKPFYGTGTRSRRNGDSVPECEAAIRDRRAPRVVHELREVCGICSRHGDPVVRVGHAA